MPRLPVVALVALGFAVCAASAAGHAATGSLSPAPDQTLGRPPSTIHVVFGERVGVGRDALRLIDATGRSRGGIARLSGRQLTVRVRGTLGPGRYGYAYTATSADGHVIRRAVAFAVRSRTPPARSLTLRLSGQRLPLSGARVGVRTLRLWGGLEEGTAEWRHPFLPAPLTWTFADGRARGMLPFPGTYRLTVRALTDGFSERIVSGTVTIAR